MRYHDYSFDLSELRLPDRGDGGGAFDGARLPKKPLLSVEQIKERVEVYRSMKAGKFPSSLSGNVLNADGSEKGETWKEIDQLFNRAARGFPARGLQGCGFTSLADFLDRTYPEERKPRAKKSDLTSEQIKEWVDVYRSANAGAFPSVGSGNVLNSDGSEAGEMWSGIDSLFRIAAKGSPARGLKDCRFTSLAHFLDETYPYERAPRVEKADLTLELIKEWVDVYRVANEGKFPSIGGGHVLDADGSETGEKWMGIDQLFKSAAKGALARGLKGCGFTSLSDFLDKTYPDERQPRIKRIEKVDLTPEQIEDWVDVYRSANAGAFPSALSGNVLDADGSEMGENWRGIDRLFRAAAQGFPARGLKGCGFTSLADFLDKTYPEERKPRAQRVEKRDLTLEQIKEWVDVYRVANKGRFPSAYSDNVLNADGNETGEKWLGIDALFRIAAEGFPARGLKDCGFTSLSDFLDKTYPEERKPRAKRVEKAGLTPEQIKEWVEVYRNANAGAFPSALSGNVLNADGSETGETWGVIHQLFRTAAKGAPARGLKGCGFTSLADFLDKTYPEERKRERKIKYPDQDILLRMFE